MPITASVSATADVEQPAVESRVVCLDGVRGLMTIMVLISHYFGEIPHGIKALMFGWIAVDMFFVLSGYLVGKLILEKQHNDNFFQVFYIRRVCRTLPIYFVCLAVNIVLMTAFAAPWVDADEPFPAWSYFTFTQNFYMAATGGIGAHWLSPTWTLAIEEHFYLIVPFLFVVVPRRRLAVGAGHHEGELVGRLRHGEALDVGPRIPGLPLAGRDRHRGWAPGAGVPAGPHPFAGLTRAVPRAGRRRQPPSDGPAEDELADGRRVRSGA